MIRAFHALLLCAVGLLVCANSVYAADCKVFQQFPTDAGGTGSSAVIMAKVGPVSK